MLYNLFESISSENLLNSLRKYKKILKIRTGFEKLSHKFQETQRQSVVFLS